jgi:hypothetical protein
MTVTATDDGLPSQTLTYTISDGADMAKFEINSSTGVLMFLSAPDFEEPTDDGANNVYDVTVQVSDGELSDVQEIEVSVTNLNEAPVVTSDGGGSTASRNVAEGDTLVTTVTATDPDAATTLTYSIVPAGDGAKFMIDGSTGALTFVSAADFEAPSDDDGNNVYDVTVQVSDGMLTDTQAIAVTITDVPEGLAGDYNEDGTVDAADYVVWRKSLNSMVPAFTGADGNGNGMVDQADYDIWRANFGRTSSTAIAASLQQLWPSSVPSPAETATLAEPPAIEVPGPIAPSFLAVAIPDRITDVHMRTDRPSCRAPIIEPTSRDQALMALLLNQSSNTRRDSLSRSTIDSLAETNAGDDPQISPATLDAAFAMLGSI